MAKAATPDASYRASSTTAAGAVPPIASTGFSTLVPPGTSAGGTEVVLCADFDRYGTRLVTGGADHRLRMYERTEERWELIDVWRAHNGMILDVRFSPLPSSTIPLFASTGEDLRLKIWASDPTAPASSGRRFYCTFSQSAGHAAVAYVALALSAPAMPAPDLLLAAVTRDGLLSLLEPVPEVEQRAAAATNGGNRRHGQEWRELDQMFAADGPVQRGTETSFRLAFQPYPTPTSYMQSTSSIDSKPVSLAVASLNELRIYPLVPPSPYPASSTTAPFASSTNSGVGSYRFGAPLAVIQAGNGRLVRDVAWSPAAHRMSAWIAVAAADGMVRVYDIASPKTRRRPGHSGHTSFDEGTNGNGSDSVGGRTGFAERAGAPAASQLTASLSRAGQRPGQQPQTPQQPETTSVLFPGAPSMSHLSTQSPAEPDDGSSGLGPSPSPGPGAGPSAPPGSSSSRLDAKLVAELEHAGVWRVSWIRTGAMVISMGDTGEGRVWGPGMGGNWVEFAEFGAESEGE